LGTAAREGCAGDERWHLRKDGGRVFMNGSVHPLPRDAQGREQGFIKIARDETARRAADEALRESEARYRSLFNSIDAGFCVIEMKFDNAGRGLDYRFVEVNPAFQRQTGLADATGRWVLDLVPAHEQHWFDIYGRVALTGEPARFENRAEALGRWFDVHAFRVGGPEERRVAVLFNDISERRAAEDVVRITEERYRLAARATNDAIWDWDLAANRVLWNEALETAYGHPLAEVEPTGNWWIDHIHPDDRARIDRIFMPSSMARRRAGLTNTASGAPTAAMPTCSTAAT
jgi:PAS domain S-box-containing protein